MSDRFQSLIKTWNTMLIPVISLCPMACNEHNVRQGIQSTGQHKCSICLEMQDYKKALNSVMKYYILWSNNGNSEKTISLVGNNGNMYNTFDMYYWQIKININ